MTLPFDVVLERANRGDAKLVYSSWIKSYRHSEAAHKLPNGVYEPFQRDVIHRLLAAPGTCVYVARPTDWPDGVLGWVCAEPGVMHYAYVKSPYRRLGLGRTLLAYAAEQLGEAFTAYTHKRKPWTEALERQGLVYAPERARKKRAHG